MRISDWSSDVCSSDLHLLPAEIKEQLFFNRVNTQGRQCQQPPALQNRFDVEPRQRHASIHRSQPRPRPLKMMSILATGTRICHGYKLESKRRKQKEHLTRRTASRFQTHSGPLHAIAGRTAERRVGKECYRKWRSRWV